MWSRKYSMWKLVVEIVLICLYRILSSMFPDLDKDVIDDVVRLKEGRLVH